MSTKTIIFNGSPRKNGNTAFLISNLIKELNGEYKIVNAYTADISPCIDCRKCREQSGCIIQDDMQDIYEYLENCDNIVIASPIYFTELTGKLLDISSRLQTYFSAKYFRNETPAIKLKKGIVMLTGGGKGNPQRAYDTAVCILHCINVQNIYPLICSHNTDKIPASEDKAVISEIKKAADFIND